MDRPNYTNELKEKLFVTIILYNIHNINIKNKKNIYIIVNNY